MADQFTLENRFHPSVCSNPIISVHTVQGTEIGNSVLYKFSYAYTREIF